MAIMCNKIKNLKSSSKAINIFLGLMQDHMIARWKLTELWQFPSSIGWTYMYPRQVNIFIYNSFHPTLAGHTCTPVR